MTTVTRDEVIEAWDQLCELDEEPTDELVKRFMDEQPALGLYLAAGHEAMGEEAEESPLIDLAVTIWQVMSRGAGQSLKSVTPEAVEQAEAENEQMLESLAESSDVESKSAAEQLATNYHQWPILGFCLEMLMQENEESPELAPERIGLELLMLKTLIDCLDQYATPERV
ncbi:MAG TPA: hypothetical protein VNT26_19390 [Candidatus Sulfotelmatobacter sp.]|nr:hypothetical protein [Candidatus Sulfotelmatobacter sp.]HWI56457.1 hypothetical protein [Bacillota bacterium]